MVNMKTLFSIVFLTFTVLAFGQSAVKKAPALIVGGNVVKKKETVTIGLRIQSGSQKDIKELTEAMKPYEDQWREYNRLLGLRTNIYTTLMKSTVYSIDSLAAQPVITQDSIKMVFKK